MPNNKLSQMKRVLVLDANQRSALAVTRSLGRKNITVFTADDTTDSLAGHSCFSQHYLTYPSPKRQSNAFIQSIIAFIEQHGIDILIPMTELTAELLLKNQNAFCDTIIPFANVETVEALSNKCALMRMAKELHIPIPETWFADSPEALPLPLEELSYPLVLKPGKSWLQHNGQWDRAAVLFADNPEQAQQLLHNNIGFHAHPFILQDCVPGHGAGVFAIYDHGKPVAFFAHNRLREKPPSGGVSVLSESTSINPTLLKHTRALLDKAQWHGIAMVEFRVADDGTPYLMEINTRFWGSLQLAIDAGVDFPWLLYQLACNETPDAVTDFKKGVRLRWVLGDIDNLYLTLRDKQYSLFEKLNVIRRFLTPSLFNTRHEVNRVNDLAPAWFEFKQYLRNLRN